MQSASNESTVEHCPIGPTAYPAPRPDIGRETQKPIIVRVASVEYVVNKSHSRNVDRASAEQDVENAIPNRPVAYVNRRGVCMIVRQLTQEALTIQPLVSIEDVAVRLFGKVTIRLDAIRMIAENKALGIKHVRNQIV